MTTITRGLVNCCWFFFKWGLLVLIVGGSLAVPFVYQRVDEEIRLRIENKYAASYPHLIVRVRHAQLVENQGIEVRGLSLVEKGAEGPQAELAYFDEIFLTCQTTVQELLKGEPTITHVRIRRPVVRQTRRPDGSWSLSKLWPLPKIGQTPPETAIENGTLEIFDPLKNPSSMLTVRDIHLMLRPAAAREEGEIEPMELEGYLAADQLQRVDFKGRIDRRSSHWSLAGTVDGLEVSPELRAALPSELSEKLMALGGLRCETRLAFQANHSADRPQPLHFKMIADIDRGRIDDARLPFSLTDLRGRGKFDNTGFIVDLTARNGQANLSVNFRHQGYSADRPCYLQVIGHKVSLDEKLVRVLPESIRDQWYRYLPAGEIDADLKLAFDGSRWKSENVEINCLNVSFTCSKFPYRLERGTGTLVYKNRHLDVDLTAYSGGQPIELDAHIDNPGPHFTGSFEAQGDRIPFDEKLFSALADGSRPIVRSLHPEGTFNFYFRQWRDDPQRPLSHQHLVMGLNRCSINYEGFPYPLSNIRGKLELQDGSWTFQDLEGTNDTGFIKGSGSLEPGPAGKRLLLTIKGDNVPLEEELRDALPPSMGKLWNSLKPRGSTDLQVELTHDSEPRRTDINLYAWPRPETSSIEPVYFPYRLEKFQGMIHYQNGHTELEDLVARHGQTRVSTGGICDIAPDGGFHLRLKNLSVDRFKADHELVVALPEGLRRIVSGLRPTGSVNLRGDVDFSKSGAPDALLESAWDVSFDMHHASVEAGLKLENVSGSAKFKGKFDGKEFQSRGELALDAVTYKNFQFTNVAGPLLIDNQNVLLGSWAEARDKEKSPRRATAKIFGGLMQGDCQVTLTGTPQYMLRFTVADADLRQFVMENVDGRQHLDGKVLANVELQGSGNNRETLHGAGNIRVRDANIYDLPLTVALLKILRARAPDTTAFTKSDIDFRLQGDHILFDRMNFSGDAISLNGTGQMNFDRQIDLRFSSIVGRDENLVPFFRNMLGQASQQIMEIRVVGTVDHPVQESQAFPRVSQAFQRWQEEMQRPSTATAPPPPPPPPTAAKPGSLLPTAVLRR